LNKIKVYSHPRSGTHLLEATLAVNFYQNVNLEEDNVIWGHWSNRLKREDSNPYGKLFGSHIFPTAVKSIDHPAIYIYRDPRAVAYSIWKTPNFLNPTWTEISFSDFLRKKLDWVGSPAYKCRRKYTIFKHWEKHVLGWLKLTDNNENLIAIRYEELIENPTQVLMEISKKFSFDKKEDFQKVEQNVGIFPNKGTVNSWKEAFTENDLIFVRKRIKSRYLKSIYFEGSTYH
jgi:hypothetical protein